MNFQLFAFCLLAVAYRAEATCTALPGVVQGTLSPATVPTGGFADSATVTVTCNAGYAITTDTTTCDATNNQWSPATLTCAAAFCAAEPTTLTQGTFPAVPTGGYSGTVSITCNSGYEVATGDASSSLCTTTNTWNPTSLTCTAATCAAAPTTLTQGTFPAVPTGGYTGTVSIICNSGYTVASGAASSSLCTTTNTWSPTTLECVSSCNAAPTLTQGTFPTMPTGGYSGSVSITCNAGYISASGAATSATCSATNTWNTTSLTCTAATCAAAPTTLTQGTFPAVPSGGYTGTVAITCNSGYKAGSTNSSLCTTTDTWDPTSLVCTAITCSALTVTNGAVAPTGTVAYNGEVTVTCDSGYTLSSTTGDLKCDGTLANNYNATTPTCTATTTVSTTGGSASLFHLHTPLMAMLLSAFAFIKVL